MALARWEPDEAMMRADWSPAMDVQETEHEYAIETDLPDVRKEDVRVMLDNGVLTIEGERRLQEEDTGKRYHRIERAYGRFARRFALPGEVDGTRVNADFKDGVLSIRLPKSANGAARTVAVKIA